MKIALDVDGVISEAPAFFVALTQALQAAGHRIYVVTDHDQYYRMQREAELRDWSIAYDELVVTGAKERFCQEHGIDFAVDDEAVEYYPRSRTVTLRLVAVGTSLGTNSTT